MTDRSETTDRQRWSRKFGPVVILISHLFLTGARVFKLKRAMSLPYLDFSTAKQRLAACEKELHLNRRTAPELYLGVRRITEGARGPEFDGAGALLDAVVEMRRFDQADVFDAMAQRGALTARHLDALAREISTFHADAPVDADAQGAGNIAAVLRVNAAAFRQNDLFAEADIARLDAAFEAALDTHAARLDARARAGHVRRCHGNLHLRNICLFEGRVRLFDCLEFNDALATVDVLYDLAFLAMDLWHRGLHVEASQVVNRYCDMSGQEDGFVLLPVFMALRAAVRAHVMATQAAGASGDGAGIAAEARAYFDLAERLLMPKAARLVAVGGLSGSGKSTIAAVLAPHLGRAPGARVIASDRTRKAMFQTDADQPLPVEAYTADRDRIAAAADAAGVPFSGFWLRADPEDLHARLKTRDPGASDADADVLADQLARAPDATGWQTVSTGGAVAQSVDAVLTQVRG